MIDFASISDLIVSALGYLAVSMPDIAMFGLFLAVVAAFPVLHRLSVRLCRYILTRGL